MLTTFDNPFDPFTEFEEWFSWDTKAGYNTCSFLARRTFSSNELSDADQELAIQQAIDEIIKENVCGMWRKVSKVSGTE